MSALVIGKFMPLHNGHISLVEFALQQTGRVVVLVGALDGEPIPGKLRYHWVKKQFAHEPRIRVEYTDEPLPTAVKADTEVARTWAHYLKKRFPEVSIMVSSEEYGRVVADFMSIRWVDFDLDRKGTPISASLIRENPWKYWDFIPEIVRPWFTKKICLYGPESTGKTTMSLRLANHYKSAYVPEIARDIVSEAGGFTPSLVQKIADEHALAIQEALPRARRWLFVDSDIITTQIFSRHYHNISPELTPDILEANTFDHYFLFNIDVPWIEDEQRLEPENRQFFFDWFKKELVERELDFTLVEGDWNERFHIITNTLNSWKDFPN